MRQSHSISTVCFLAGLLFVGNVTSDASGTPGKAAAPAASAGGGGSTASATGQPTPTPTPVDDLTLGETYSVRTHSSVPTYIFTYKGQDVGKQSATPSSFKSTGSFFPSTTGLNQDLVINLNEGTTTFNNGYANLFKKNPFDFKPLNSRHYYTVGAYATDLDAKNREFTYGLERTPFQLRDIGLGNGFDLANFVIPGIAFEKHWDNTSASTESDVGIVTSRYYIGQTYGFIHTGTLSFTVPDITSTYSSVDSLLNAYQGGFKDVTDKTEIEFLKYQCLLISPPGPGFAPPNPAYMTEAKDDLSTWLTKRYNSWYDGYTDFPKFAVSVQGEAWYNATVDKSEPRLNNGVALVFDHWFNINKAAQRDGGLSNFEIRYNNGRLYSSPAQTVNEFQVMLTFHH